MPIRPTSSGTARRSTSSPSSSSSSTRDAPLASCWRSIKRGLRNSLSRALTLSTGGRGRSAYGDQLDNLAGPLPRNARRRWASARSRSQRIRFSHATAKVEEIHINQTVPEPVHKVSQRSVPAARVGEFLISARSLAEYRAMFQLEDRDLSASILDCPGAQPRLSPK